MMATSRRLCKPRPTATPQWTLPLIPPTPLTLETRRQLVFLGSLGLLQGGRRGTRRGGPSVMLSWKRESLTMTWRLPGGSR